MRSPHRLDVAGGVPGEGGVAHALVGAFFDPSRVAAIRNGRSIVDLSTGVIMGHEIGSSMFGTTEVVPMDVLEELRGNVGWSITADRELLAATFDRVFGYVPVYLQSDAVYAQYVESARANYETQAGAA